LMQLGGLQGARIFKVPGARNLLKKYGPRDTFSGSHARDSIVDKSSENTHGTFAPHADLFLEQRATDTKLTPPDVFAFMVKKGLFRIGVELDCPKCGMRSWVALDVLKQKSNCELCGNDFDATSQLLKREWRFRRSGILGAERNVQGAIPVALALQQLDANLEGVGRHNSYSPSLDITVAANPIVAGCEIDFVWLSNDRFPDPADLIIAECKDAGSIKVAEFEKDVESLRRVADAFPRNRFRVYILFVKLAPFTADEITMAKTLNGRYQQRVIMLTDKELEPYHFFEAIKGTHGIDSYGGSAEELALVTAQLYFAESK